MRRRRGSFARSLEESCEIRRARPQRQTGESEFIVVAAAQKIIIDNATRQNYADVSETIDLDNRYVGNIRPPNADIMIADQVVRTSLGDVLTVVKITTIRDVQRLYLEDRYNTVA